MPDPVIRAFKAAAHSYDRYAFIQSEIRARLMERLTYLSQTPARVLDVGCGTGHLMSSIQKQWPQAAVMGVDAAYTMCQQGHGLNMICADARALPWPDHTMDVVISNCLIQWFINDLPDVLNEMLRVLKPGGVMLLSTFGPDTLQEVRHAWSQVDAFEHVNAFSDMHQLGDVVRSMGFHDVVMDRWPVTLEMHSAHQVLEDIKGVGAQVILSENAPRGLTTPRKLKRFITAYEADFSLDSGGVNVTYEVVFGQAWKPLTSSEDVPLEAIERPSQRA